MHAHTGVVIVEVDERDIGGISTRYGSVTAGVYQRPAAQVDHPTEETSATRTPSSSVREYLYGRQCQPRQTVLTDIW